MGQKYFAVGGLAAGEGVPPQQHEEAWESELMGMGKNGSSKSMRQSEYPSQFLVEDQLGKIHPDLHSLAAGGGMCNLIYHESKNEPDTNLQRLVPPAGGLGAFVFRYNHE